MKLLPTSWHDITVFVFGVLLLVIGVLDTWYFKQRFGAGLDVGFVLAGPAGVGLNVAYQAGLAADPKAPPAA